MNQRRIVQAHSSCTDIGINWWRFLPRSLIISVLELGYEFLQRIFNTLMKRMSGPIWNKKAIPSQPPLLKHNISYNLLWFYSSPQKYKIREDKISSSGCECRQGKASPRWWSAACLGLYGCIWGQGSAGGPLLAGSLIQAVLQVAAHASCKISVLCREKKNSNAECSEWKARAEPSVPSSQGQNPYCMLQSQLGFTPAIAFFPVMCGPAVPPNHPSLPLLHI